MNMASHNTLRVLAYTGGWNTPSGVWRVQQYVKPLHEFGIDLRNCPSSVGSHPPLKKWLRPVWGISNLLDRAPDTLRSLAYDVVFFQREMLSTFVTWEPLTKGPRILDVDDAIWMNPRGDFAERLARRCDHVICGNQFLAEQFSRWNPDISILPTPVDTAMFCPGTKQKDESRPVIGWMGLYTGFPYLYSIEPALRQVLLNNPNAILRTVCSHRPVFRSLPPEQVEHVTWTPENEARTIQEMTIGIMPLDGSVFSRGKCSFKMLLYMACGVPVVVTPVGMNTEVLGKGNVGFGAATERDWVDALTELLRNSRLRSEMGRTGRDVVLRNYSVDVLAPKLAFTLLRVGGKPVSAQHLRKATAEAEHGVRFEFGKNWERFLHDIDDERISRAEVSLEEMLGSGNLEGKSFLDVGSGSGLFSLAARKRGASVVSFDNDLKSVACTRKLKNIFFRGDQHWRIERGSALDKNYLRALGSFDVVYCWGVLHHTGSMWTALENMIPLVKEGGKLFLAIYNDQGGLSKFWRAVKRTYNHMHPRLRFLVLWPISLYFVTGITVKDILYLRRPRVFTEYDGVRGMSVWANVVDWVGGYPFEVASREKIVEFYRQRGFTLDRLVSCGRKLGCNQYVFVRGTENSVIAEAARIAALSDQPQLPQS